MYIIIVFCFTGRTIRVSVILCFQRIVITYRVLKSNKHYNSVTKTTTPCSHCNVSLVCSLCPGTFTTLSAGQIEFSNQFDILKSFIFIPFPEKKTLPFHFRYLLWGIFFKISENTIVDKNVKKNARCMSNFRILPSKAGFIQDTSPSPQKQQCWSVAETFLLPTKQHWPGKGGERCHHGAKFTWWVCCE